MKIRSLKEQNFNFDHFERIFQEFGALYQKTLLIDSIRTQNFIMGLRKNIEEVEDQI